MDELVGDSPKGSKHNVSEEEEAPLAHGAAAPASAPERQRSGGVSFAPCVVERRSAAPSIARMSAASAGADSEAAHTRLSRKSVTMIGEKTEAIELGMLVPPPDDKPPRKLRAFMVNSFVLALMVAIVAIIVAGKARIHAPEPLGRVHATNGVLPYVQEVEGGSVDYLFLNLLISPYTPRDADGGSSGGHRRKLAAWVGDALLQLDAGRIPMPPGTPAPLAAAAQAQLAKTARALLHRPKFTVARRGSAYSRRLLVEEGVQEPANESGKELPELKVTLVQRNATFVEAASAAVAPVAAANGTTSPEQAAQVALDVAELRGEGAAFFPVSEPQFCTTKEGAAVKCSMAFQGGDLTSAFVAGQPLYLAFQGTQVTQLVFQVEASELGGLGPAKNWLALTILGLVLVGIASERIHRMWCAMIGAGFMMGLLLWMNMAPSLGLVMEWLDESTLGLLFGMMIIVGRLQETGVFELMAAWAVKVAKGRMWALSLLLMLCTAFVSAWLDNVTTMLLIVPVTLSVMRTCNQDPVPIMLAQALMSNIGGTATMVGDPPALIIGNALSQYIGFMDFIINMAPGVIIAAAACIPLLLWMFRGALMGPIKNYDATLEVVSGYRITNWPLFAKCSYVTAVVIIAFLLHPVHHVDPAWFAVLGAIVLCVCDRPMEVDKVVHTVEWDMLLFFAAMFVMIEAGAEVGMISMIGGWIESAIRAVPEGSRLIVAIQILLWVSALISAVLDNIPYTITMVPVIEYLAAAGLGLDLATLAWALNFGACFGGNATLIGASANIVTATLAERAGENISFVRWLKAGIPITIVSVAIADVYMLVRYCT